MKVKDNNLHALLSLNGTDFVIPVYQRNYTWQQGHCEQLLDDILSIVSTENQSTEKQHFLGTITYIIHSGDNSIEFTIIDGQQRITTMMLLLKALQNNTHAKKNEQLQRQIDGYLFGFNDKSKVRLKPIKKDKEAFECVMGEQQFSGESNVIKNYKYFVRKTADYPQTQIQQILKTFPRLQIAEVVLDKSVGDDPQLVFERINATGLHLRGLDLIRNFLMMELKPSEQERIFENFWMKIEEIFSGKDSEKIISNFINVYLRIYYGSSLRNDEKSIYNTFKKLRKDNFSDNSEKILKDMLKFAQIYKIIIDKNAIWQYKNETPKEKKILRSKIATINYIDFGTAYPFLMRLIDDFENEWLDFENFNGILNLLISYFVRRAICAVPTNALNSVLYGLYEKLDNKTADGINAKSVARYLGQKGGNEVFPNAFMLKQGFENSSIFKSKKVVSLVLYEIEGLKNHETPALESLNIEHFYPQKSTKEWHKKVGDENEVKNLEQNYRDSFGNLTLTDSALNSKIGNKSFEEKVRLYAEKGSLHLNRYFAKCEKWGVNEIKKRAQWLFEHFEQIDIFKDIGDEFRQTPERVTLGDDWTGLKPRSIKFPNGSKKSVSSVQSAVRAIIEYLLENHANVLENAIHRDEFNFIYFGEVEQKDGFMRVDFGKFKFFCNASATSLRSAVKKLVEACDLEPSEFEIITI